MTETEFETQFRRDLEASGEQAVRDSLNHKGGVGTGGEPMLAIVRKWLREKELAREARERRAELYLRWTLLVAAATLVAAIAAVIVPFVHP